MLRFQRCAGTAEIARHVLDTARAEIYRGSLRMNRLEQHPTPRDCSFLIKAPKGRIADSLARHILLLLILSALTTHPKIKAALDISEVEQLISRLGNRRFTERETASRALDNIGEPALGALRNASVQSMDAEIRRRASALVLTIEQRLTKQARERAIAMILRNRGTYLVEAAKPQHPVWKVDLSHTGVQDTDLLELQGLTDLEVLILFDTKITDAGLYHLRPFRSLCALDLSDTRVSGEGLVHLVKMRHLESLKLTGTRITDKSLAYVQHLHSLWLLDLGGTRIGDAGLIHLHPLVRLSRLSLCRTQITDGGLSKLPGLPSLEVIFLDHTKVTAEGATALRTARRNLRVED
jgi:Leucine Rich repeat